MRGCKRAWMNRICQVHDIKGRCAQVRPAPSWNSAKLKCDYVESTVLSSLCFKSQAFLTAVSVVKNPRIAKVSLYGTAGS